WARLPSRWWEHTGSAFNRQELMSLYLVATALAFWNPYVSIAVCYGLWVVWAITGYERLPEEDESPPPEALTSAKNGRNYGPHSCRSGAWQVAPPAPVLSGHRSRIEA